MNHLLAQSQKGKLDEQQSVRLSQLVKEYNLWRNFTHEEREYKRLREYQNAVLSEAQSQVSSERTIARKDINFYLERYSELKNKLPFHSTWLGITTTTTTLRDHTE